MTTNAIPIDYASPALALWVWAVHLKVEPKRTTKMTLLQTAYAMLAVSYIVAVVGLWVGH